MPKLTDLIDGQDAVITRIDLPAQLASRFMEMGLMEGCKVTLLRRAPLGDPLELQVGGARLSLRSVDAAGIEVSR